MKVMMLLSSALLAMALGGTVYAQDPVASDDIGLINPEAAAKAFPKRGFSPYAGRNYPTRVFWGDQHVHTGWSADAGMSGATLTPTDALRFARGERVVAPRMKRPPMRLKVSGDPWMAVRCM